MASESGKTCMHAFMWAQELAARLAKFNSTIQYAIDYNSKNTLAWVRSTTGIGNIRRRVPVELLLWSRHAARSSAAAGTMRMM